MRTAPIIIPILLITLLSGCTLPPQKNIDSDGDGWTDTYEQQIGGTNPYLSDTDLDGHTDPTDPEPFDPTIPAKSPSETPQPVVWQKAQKTETEATQEVSSNLRVDAVVGNVIGERVDRLNISVSLAAGASPVDMRNVVIKYINETTVSTLTCSSYMVDATHFKYIEERDPSATGSNVLGPGDLGRITLDLSAMGQELYTRKEATIQIIPKTGVLIQQILVAPPTYADKSRWQLYP